MSPWLHEIHETRRYSILYFTEGVTVVVKHLQQFHSLMRLVKFSLFHLA